MNDKEFQAYGNHQWGNYKVCGVCGRDNSWDEEDWSQKDICPNCEADQKADHNQWDEALGQEEPAA